MNALALKTVPTNRQLLTALHQDEGILLETERGEEYTFVPRYDVTADGSINGSYCQISHGQFTDIRGRAILNISPDKTTATLTLLPPL